MNNIWTKEYVNSIKHIIRQALLATIGNHSDLEDFEQEALTHVFVNHDKIPTGRSRTSYIHRLAKNCAYDMIRRQKRFNSCVQEIFSYNQESFGKDVIEINSLVAQPREMSDPFVANVVSETISKLSPTHQKVLLLRAEDIEYKDMAKVLNISEGTVRSRLHYARKQCAERLLPLLG